MNNYRILVIITLTAPEATLEVAKRLGYDRLEIHPGLTVVRKFEKFERTDNIGLPNSTVSSAHSPFGRDKTAASEYKLQNVDVLQNPIKTLVSKAIWASYPDKKIRHEAISKIAGYYGIPAIIHWPKDEPRYQKPILEINRHLKRSEIDEWLNRGLRLAVDINDRKLGDFYKRQKIPVNERGMLFLDLLHHAEEDHFQIDSPDEWKQIRTGDTEDSLGNMIRTVKQEKPEIPIVVEVNATLTPIHSAAAYAGFTPKHFTEIVEFIRKA